MSFLHRKRVRDATSMGGDDALSLSQVYPRNGESPRVPRNTQIVAGDFAVNESCVLRGFPKHRSSDLRFLAWVAYTRKFTDDSMTDDERRTCPLLWCREVFPAEDAMLKHVYHCEHLSKGLYWCLHCQKPERVGKFQCKRCLGAPSRADRLASVAKKLLSGLGVKRVAEERPSPAPIRKFSPLKIPGPSAYVPKSENLIPQRKSSMDHGEWTPQELPNSYICEMEGGCVYSQELPDSQISEILEVEKPNDAWEWPTNEILPAPPYVESIRRPSPPMLPRLNTYVNDEQRLQDHSLLGVPMSATIVSPLSASEPSFGAFNISPTDSDASGTSIFTDSGYSSTTVETPVDESGSSLGWGSRYRQTRDLVRDLDPPGCRTDSVLTTHAASLKSPQISAMPISNNFKDQSSDTSIPGVSHSARRCTMSGNPQILSPHWSDAKVLLESLSEVLHEHVLHSQTALKQMPPGSMTAELLALSSSSIQSIGFEVLKWLLEGRNPSTPVHIFSFTTLAYSMAIVMDNDTSKLQTEYWFQQSLSWLTLLSEEDQRIYEQVARSIWRPRLAPNDIVNPLLLGPLPETENRPLTACKHFLDILQSSRLLQDRTAEPSQQFDFEQVAFVHKVKARIIDQLIQKPSIEAFIEDVVAVEKRLDNRLITNLRQLELELIYSGKLASQSDRAYSRFLGHVTSLCDTLYAEGNARPREAYQIDAIMLAHCSTIVCHYPSHGGEDESPQFDIDHWIDNNYASLELSQLDTSTQTSIFSTGDDFILDSSPDFSSVHFTSETTVLEHTLHSQNSIVDDWSMQQLSTSPARLNSQLSTSSTNFNPQPLSNSSSKYRCHCGYIPTGEEKWKASNLARHKRTQHPSSGSRAYRCNFEGCESVFTRSDNLREHMRKKGHDCWNTGESTRTGEKAVKRRISRKCGMDTGLR